MKPTAAGCMERVIDYLQQRAAAQGVALPSETESLLKSDVLDSFGMLEFVGFIEEELKIHIPDDDLLVGNFDTVAKIREYISGRTGD